MVTKKDLELMKTYRKIDNIFVKIRDIADSYLEEKYPAAPDPDLFIEKILKQIERYNDLIYK